jgi:putative peptidoglycan lipid II flippase
VKKLSFVSRTSLLLAGFFFIDKILAFGRSLIIARRFSLSAELDAFNVANNLPDLLFALISGGAFAMAFIPVLTEHITQKGRDDAWALFSRVANLAFVATASLAVVIALFADRIVRSQIGIAPGFGPEQQELVTQLMRFNLVATIIFSISGLVMAGLQANQHFLLPAMAPIMYNLGQIFGVFVLVPVFGVYGLVYGVIIGALLHLGIQIPGLFKYKFHWTPDLTIKDEGVREVLRVVGPRLLTMLFIQLTFIARDNFASRLEQVGAISALTYGWMIMQVPETLIGTAIATALLPTLSQLFTRKEAIVFRDTVERAVRVVIAITIPVAALLIVGLPSLISFAFGFNQGDTEMLTRTAQVYMLVLTGYALQEILARTFYSRLEAVVPLRGVIIRFIIYLAIGASVVAFFPQWGAAGIALAELSLTVEAVFMLVWLNRRVEPPVKAWGAVVRGGSAALIGGAAAYGLVMWLPIPGAMAALVAMAIGLLAGIPFILPYLRLMLRL